MYDQKVAQVLAVCGEVHETPDELDCNYLTPYPTNPVPQLFYNQGDYTRRNECFHLVSCTVGNIDENPARFFLLVREFRYSTDT